MRQERFARDGLARGLEQARAIRDRRLVELALGLDHEPGDVAQPRAVAGDGEIRAGQPGEAQIAERSGKRARKTRSAGHRSEKAQLAAARRLESGACRHRFERERARGRDTTTREARRGDARGKLRDAEARQPHRGRPRARHRAREVVGGAASGGDDGQRPRRRKGQREGVRGFEAAGRRGRQHATDARRSVHLLHLSRTLCRANRERRHHVAEALTLARAA